MIFLNSHIFSKSSPISSRIESLGVLIMTDNLLIFSHYLFYNVY